MKQPTAPVRPFWSGTITFGLVSIPVDLVAAVRPRQTSMKLVDDEGHPLGRRYWCPKHEKALKSDEIVRGYETEAGKTVVITDEEFESVAPEKSRDIQLERFVPLAAIPPFYFDRPYFLAPDERAGKAYALLAQTLDRSGKAGIGSFVMRGREYLVAIVADSGLLRAEVLRYGDELRTPQSVGLPKPAKGSPSLVRELGKQIDALGQTRLALAEMEDLQAEELRKFAQRKAKSGQGVIRMESLEDDDDDGAAGAEVIDLMQLLRKSLGARTGASKAGTVRAAGKKAASPKRPAAKKAAAATKKTPAAKVAKKKPATKAVRKGA